MHIPNARTTWGCLETNANTSSSADEAKCFEDAREVAHIFRQRHMHYFIELSGTSAVEELWRSDIAMEVTVRHTIFLSRHSKLYQNHLSK